MCFYFPAKCPAVHFASARDFLHAHSPFAMTSFGTGFGLLARGLEVVGTCCGVGEDGAHEDYAGTAVYMC
jgi:hypothetical protein